MKTKCGGGIGKRKIVVSMVHNAQMNDHRNLNTIIYGANPYPHS